MWHGHLTSSFPIERGRSGSSREDSMGSDFCYVTLDTFFTSRAPVSSSVKWGWQELPSHGVMVRFKKSVLTATGTWYWAGGTSVCFLSMLSFVFHWVVYKSFCSTGLDAIRGQRICRILPCNPRVTSMVLGKSAKM